MKLFDLIGQLVTPGNVQAKELSRNYSFIFVWGFVISQKDNKPSFYNYKVAVYIFGNF